MPQAVPFIASGLAALGASAAAATAIATFAVSLLSQTALTFLGSVLTRKRSRGLPPINVTIRSTISERRLCFGTVRAGGAFLFIRTSGSNNKYLWYVIAYAGHQCEDVRDLYLDKFKIADADINAGTGAVSTTALDGKLKCWTHLGTQAQTVDTNLDSEFTEWTSTHRLRGICYRVLRLERSDKAWPNGAPQSASSIVDGMKLYDPRLDSTNGGSGSHRYADPSTWAFSRNAALVVRWYLSGGSVINDDTTCLVKYGLRDANSRIDDAYIITAANICDQSLSGANAPPSGSQVRYTCDLEASCGQTRREILEEMLECLGPGQLVWIHGKWRLYAGGYDTPTHTFTELDLHGEIESQDTSGEEDRFNQISAIFIDASKDFTEQTTIIRTNAAYVTQDGGKKILKTVTLRGVTDEYRAQRIAERMLRQSRQMRTVTTTLGRQGLAVAPWETAYISHTRWSWTSREFRCVERQPVWNEENGLQCRLTWQALASSVDTDLVTADYTTGTSVTNSLQSEAPDAPTGLTATTAAGYIRFDWALGEFWLRNGSVELWEYTSNTPFASATKIWEGNGTRVDITKTDTTTRYYWVRLATIGGQTSTTEPSGNGIAGAAYYPVYATPVTDTPADSNIAYSAVTQPQIEAAGINSSITYTSPAGFATRCTVNFAGQATLSNTTSGVAVGYAYMSASVLVNGSPVFGNNIRLESFISSADSWGLISGSKTFDVPAGQAIVVNFTVGREFSTSGASPAQTIYWRGVHTEILPTKQV